MTSTRTAGRLFTWVCLALLVHTGGLTAQEAGTVALVPPPRIRVSERSNLSTRENGRYAGLLNRQVTGYLSLTADFTYEGRFFLYEQVRRDMQQVARPVDRSIESSLRVTATTLFEDAAAYPSYASLLELPATNLAPGARWEALAWVTIDPRRDGNPLRLPVLVEYRFAGIESWNAAPAHRIEAQFATRYPLPSSDDPDAPVVDYAGPLASVTGTHRLTIMLPITAVGAAPGQVAFLRDEVAERYRFDDGSELTHEGHVLLFLSGLSLEARSRIADDVRRTIEDARIPDVHVDETDTGVRLTVEALRFLPDQPVLLDAERDRLDAVARALRAIDGARFLIVGHTADVGTQESQQVLSVERARTIAAAMATRGVSPDRMDIEGRGGTEPVATNETETGRAQNRRVEIYLLEE